MFPTSATSGMAHPSAHARARGRARAVRRTQRTRARSRSARSRRTTAAATDPRSGGEAVQEQAPQAQADIECVGEGQAVSCYLEEDESKVAVADEGASALPAAFLWPLLISPFFFWGTSMVAMKVAAPHSTALFTASIRLLPAGVAVIAWAAATGKPWPSTRQAWLACALFGVVDGTLFQGFLAEGLTRVPAGVGSVIIDSQPLTVAAVACIFMGESLTTGAVVGLFLGLLGLGLLELPPETLVAWLQLDFGAGAGAGPGSPWYENGQFLMLLAAQSMAAGTLMVPWVTRFVDPVMATGWHMVLGSLPLLAAIWVYDADTLASRLVDFNAVDGLALTYTSLLGSAAAYAVFFYFASKGNLTKLSSLTFLTPVFATVTGYFVLNESLTLQQVLGASVVLAGLVLMNSSPSGGK